MKKHKFNIKGFKGVKLKPDDIPFCTSHSEVIKNESILKLDKFDKELQNNVDKAYFMNRGNK